MDSRTFQSVTEAMWLYVRDLGRDRHGTRYEGDARSGTATTDTPIGRVVLRFEFDPTTATITYSLVTKPFFLPIGMIWQGVEDAIAESRSAPKVTDA